MGLSSICLVLRVVLASSKYPNTNSNLVQIHFSEHSGKAFLPVMLSYNASYFSDMLLFYIEIVVIKENGGGSYLYFISAHTIYVPVSNMKDVRSFYYWFDSY